MNIFSDKMKILICEIMANFANKQGNYYQWSKKKKNRK